jgi:transposase
MDRYARALDLNRFSKSRASRTERAEQIGADGDWLLRHLAAPDAPEELRQLSAVEVLRQVWVQQFYVANDRIYWRTEEHGIPPSAQLISSPCDTDAHYARKYTSSWIGYKVHLTESCDDELPHLITHVTTSAGPVADGEQTPVIHRALEQKGLLPSTHLVDTGYLDAKLLVESRDSFGVDLCGPTRPDYRWQATSGSGFAARDFQIDWERQQATCPAGRTSISWTRAVDQRGNPVVKIKFSMRDCGACVHKSDCTRGRRRSITVRPQEQATALDAAREREQTEAYRAEYARRAGTQGDDLAGHSHP